MHYSSLQVVFQEVPDEISLAMSISGCSLKCPGCHSSNTWNPTYGVYLSKDEYTSLLSKYKDLCSCVLFYGGEWHRQQLKEYLLLAKEYGYKTCLYTGLTLDFFSQDFLSALDYIKTGKFVRSLGGLSHRSTNQRMYVVSTMEDITYKFWRSSDASTDSSTDSRKD